MNHEDNKGFGEKNMSFTQSSEPMIAFLVGIVWLYIVFV